MKKYKYHFSFSNWNKSVPEQIATLQVFIQTISGTLGGLAIFTEHPWIATAIGLIGIILNYSGHFVYVEEIEDVNKPKE